jgi:hypothetical protein
LQDVGRNSVVFVGREQLEYLGRVHEPVVVALCGSGLEQQHGRCSDEREQR